MLQRQMHANLSKECCGGFFTYFFYDKHSIMLQQEFKFITNGVVKFLVDY
jgi:hypothetical protein